jgi:hypothetical protein
VRLKYAIELVLAVCAGLGLVRAGGPDSLRDHDPSFVTYPGYVRYGVFLTEFGDPFCTGLVLVEGAALWIEAIRRRAPRVWGFGRLTWSLSFCVAVLTSLERAVWIVAREAMETTGPPPVGSILRQWQGWFTGEAGELVTGAGVPLCLAGLLITSLGARWPRDPSPDAREWAGRIFFGALLLLYVTHRTLAWYWE